MQAATTYEQELCIAADCSELGRVRSFAAALIASGEGASYRQ